MWFLFGLITTIGMIWYSAHARLHAKWRGTPVKSGRVGAYEYRLASHKGRTTHVAFGVNAPEGIDFYIKRENIVDKFFNWVGLSREFQTGNREFDENLYIASDDVQLHKLLKLDASVRDAMLGLASIQNYDCKFKNLRSRSGRMLVVFKTPKKFELHQVRALGNHVVPLLYEVSRAIREEGFHRSRWKEPFVYWAVGILAISTGLAANGFVQLMRLAWQTTPFLVDPKAPLPLASLMGGALVLLLALIVIVRIGRSARTHLILMELLFVGSFGAVSTSYAELRDINVEFDSSAVTEFVVQADRKRVNRHRRGPDEYFVDVRDWNGSGSIVKVEVPHGLFKTLKVGDELIIYQRVGYLDYRWVEKIKKHAL